MALPEPNVTLVRLPKGKMRVLVDGKHMSGVTAVEIVRPIKEREDADGWIRREPDGDPVVRIEVLSRFVKIENG